MAQRTFTFTSEGHIITVKCPLWGQETVYYDGAEVAGGWSWTGGDYSFSIEEDSKQVTYEVRIRVNQDSGILTLKAFRNKALVFDA